MASTQLLFLLNLSAMVLGASVCLWYLKRIRQIAAGPSVEEVRKARTILQSLGELTGHLARHDGEDSARQADRDGALESPAIPDPDLVVDSVAHFIQEHQRVQQMLTEAEKTISQQVQEIQWHAAEMRIDPLTGLANRRAMDEELLQRLASCARYGRPFSLLMIDIDHFKRFNDTHGHQAGDEVLRGVAEVLQQVTRKSDLVARFGGEEFTVLMPETTAKAAAICVERVRKRMASTAFRFDGEIHSVTASYGIAEASPGDNPASLLGRADEALYAAKRAGRNDSYWHDGGRARSAKELLRSSSIAAVDPGFLERPYMKERCSRLERASIGPSHAFAERAFSGPPAGVLNRLCRRSEFCLFVRHRLDDWRRGGSPVSVILAEVEPFDRIVADYGHGIAESLLGYIAWQIRSTVDDQDMVARYAPACFAVLPAAGSPPPDLAERLRSAVGRRSFSIQQHMIDVTVNLGLAEAHGRDDLITLLSRAQTSLAAAEPALPPPKRLSDLSTA